MRVKGKNLLFKCLIIFLTYAMIELICFIVIRSGYIPAKEPNFAFVWKNPRYPLPMADINPIWGAWHYDGPFQSQNGCIYFNYKINSYGARDKERAKESQDSGRVIVLGDSFLEGWGVNENDRLSNILEKKTGHEFLNFSCADFGTTQEYLVYKNLGMRFNHSQIAVGFLPFNDFEDDDKLHWIGRKRYKPFFVRSDTGYRLEYYKPTLEESELNKKFYASAGNSFKQTLARFLRGYTYWFNIVDYIKNRKSQIKFFSFKGNKVVSYYYDYTPQQIEKLKFILTQLRLIAPGKKILFFSIPVIPDLQRRAREGEPPLPNELRRICDSLGMTYVDLLPYFFKIKRYRNYYFFCDSHWNEKANKYAADILQSYFK